MTTIAVKRSKDSINIAYDSQVTMGNMILENNIYNDKLYIWDDIVFCMAGAISHHELLKSFLSSYTRYTCGENEMYYIVRLFASFIKYLKELGKEELSSEYIVIINKKILAVDENLSNIFEVKTFWAIGSGRDYAITAMHLNKTAKSAVKVAGKIDPYTATPIKTHTIWY